MIGSYGDVVFNVSAEQVKTFGDFSRETRIKFAKHEIYNGKPVLQHTGAENCTVSMSIQLKASLGVNPKQEIDKLKQLADAGEEKPLVIGEEILGKYVLESISEKREHIDNRGNIINASVTIKLTEYVDYEKQ